MTTDDFLILEKTILLFFDTEENFNNKSTKLKLGDLFQEIILIDNLQKFQDVLQRQLATDQCFLFAIHLNHAQENLGHANFRDSKIQMKFPGLKYIFVSSAPKHMLYEDGANGDRIVYSYSNLHEDIRILPRQTKQKMAQQVTASSTTQQVEAKFPQIDYAIITALYDDEFEEIEKVFEWQPDDGHIETATKLFRLGHVKGKPEKRIVAAVPSATGMIDSAIVATMILEYFKPKYLFMTGVCGGVPKLNFGSIILASKIYIFQKGKVSDLKDNENNKIQLFDNDNKLVDTYALYDADHKLVRIGIEKFEVEHDDVPTLDSVIKDKLHPRLKSITDKLNAPYRGREEEMIKIEVEAMACSTMVIDRAGYFEENIKIHDRKILAVEMESYGIARACKFANGGKTKWVIMKAVMDNMTQKSDGYKSKAAYTSANFLKIILEEDYL